MTLFICTTDQVRVIKFASIFVGVMPLLELKLLDIQFSTLFSYMLWHIELKFCIWLCFTVLQIKFQCRQFLWELCPFGNLNYWKYSFPHFSPTCFDILSWNYAHDFVLMYYRSSLSVVNLRQVLWELCPFWNLNYWKHTVFRTFLLHALTYWVEIVHMTLFYCTTDQVRVSSICINFLWELCPFWNFEYLKYTVFRTFLFHALAYWAEIFHVTLFYCTTDQDRVSSIFVGVMPLLELKLLEIQFSALFSYMLWHIELKFCTWLCSNVLQI